MRGSQNDWGNAAPDMSSSIELIEWLLVDADDAQKVEALLPPILESLRARRAALLEETLLPAPGRSSSTAAEFALLTSRLIRLAREVKAVPVKTAVANELFSALLAFRTAQTAVASTANCFLMGCLADDGAMPLLSQAQRHDVVSFALVNLGRAVGFVHWERAPLEVGFGDETLVFSLDILTEEVRRYGSPLAGVASSTSGVTSPTPSSGTHSASTIECEEAEENVATQAFKGSAMLLFNALEQSSGQSSIAASPPDKKQQQQMSEGVLHAACKLSVVCALSCHQHQARCVALLIQSLSVFGCALRRSTVAHRVGALSDAPLGMRGGAALSPIPTCSPFNGTMSSPSAHEEFLDSATPLAPDGATGAAGVTLQGMRDSSSVTHSARPTASVLSAAVVGLAQMGSHNVEMFGAPATSALVAVIIEEDLLCRVPLGARARIRYVQERARTRTRLRLCVCVWPLCFHFRSSPSPCPRLDISSCLA